MDYPNPLTRNLDVNGKFKGGSDPTIDEAEDMNLVYDSLISLIVAAGLTPNNANPDLVRDAVTALITPVVEFLNAKTGVNASAGLNSSTVYSVGNSSLIFGAPISDPDNLIVGNTFVCPVGFSKVDIQLQCSLDDTLGVLMTCIIGTYGVYDYFTTENNGVRSYVLFSLIGAEIAPGENVFFRLSAKDGNSSIDNSGGTTLPRVYVRFYN